MKEDKKALIREDRSDKGAVVRERTNQGSLSERTKVIRERGRHGL